MKKSADAQSTAGMKLYVLDAGQINIPDKGHLAAGRGGKPITIPDPMFLIDHPKGLVVFDTGLNPEAMPEAQSKQADTQPEQRVDKQLIQLGYKPEDVKYVIISHYHLDHTGGMTLFPKATFIVRKEELKAAWWPESSEKPGYLFANYKDTRDYNFIQPLDGEEVDIFGDGSLICIDTKGHTRGHQSLIVNLPIYGKIVLAADAVSLAENLDEKVLPGHEIWSSEMAVRAIENLQQMQKAGALIILGHDPVLWKTLKKAPDYYE